MHLPPSFIILCLLVRQVSCRQTNRRRWKHPMLFATLRRWEITERDNDNGWRCTNSAIVTSYCVFKLAVRITFSAAVVAVTKRHACIQCGCLSVWNERMCLWCSVPFIAYKPQSHNCGSASSLLHDVSKSVRQGMLGCADFYTCTVYIDLLSIFPDKDQNRLASKPKFWPPPRNQWPWPQDTLAFALKFWPWPWNNVPL